MWAKITESFRGIIYSSDRQTVSTPRKRKLPIEEERTIDNLETKKQKLDHSPVSASVPGRITVLMEWMLKTKKSFAETFYFKKSKDSHKNIADKVTGSPQETDETTGHFYPQHHTQPQQQHQHTSFVQFQQAFPQTNTFRSQTMENKDHSHQARGKYQQEYNFSKAEHNLDSFQFAKSKENFSFKATQGKSTTQQTVNRYLPTSSQSVRDRSNLFQPNKSVYDRIYGSRQESSSFLSKSRERSRMAAKESFRLEEKRRYGKLLNQFTGVQSTTRSGFPQIRQSHFTNFSSLLKPAVLDFSEQKKNTPSASVRPKVRTNTATEEHSSLAKQSPVEPNRPAHASGVIDLTQDEKPEPKTDVNHMTKGDGERSSSTSSQLRDRVQLEVLTPVSRWQKHPERKGTNVPKTDLKSDDSEAFNFAEPAPLLKSPAQQKLEQQLNESKYADTEWITSLQQKYSQDKRRKERAIQEEEIKCQYHKEKREEFDKCFEEYVRQRLIIAEKEPAVIEEPCIEDAVQEIEDEFIALTEDQEQAVNRALMPNPGSEVLVEGFRLQLTRKDLSTLGGLNWLNDEVINFYMNMIMERGSQPDKPSVHAFNTFFYPKILSSGHSGVRRWTKKIDIFSMDYIMVPVHLGMHWCLAVVDFRKKEIRYYDSMGGHNNQCLNALKQYLEDESMDKKKQPYDTSSFNLIRVQDIPHQMNGSDCGMFTCKFAEFISRDAPITFTQEHMPYFRRKMVLEILTKRFY